MKFKFNGGRGAILCEKCGIILKQGREIPEYVWEAVKNGTVKGVRESLVTSILVTQKMLDNNKKV